MPKYVRTNIVSKSGVNFCKTVVEAAGCLFHSISGDNDIGIDATIELLRNGTPLHVQIAAQIRSGQSYYNEKSRTCSIEVGSHRDYWCKHPLPVIGIVFVPQLGRAHWVMIKPYLETFPGASRVRFTATEANRFDSENFCTVFVPRFTRDIPTISIASALQLVQSAHEDEMYLGLVVLFRRYPRERATWDAMLDLFYRLPADLIPAELIYFLAHVPGHPDIFYFGEQPNAEVMSYAKEKLLCFGYREVVKLLSLIDGEMGISRGSVGQSVEALISFLPKAVYILNDIVHDPMHPMEIRERAAFVLGMHMGKDATSAFSKLIADGSSYAVEMLKYVNEFGKFYPYQ
jgi:hypothetical protein